MTTVLAGATVQADNSVTFERMVVEGVAPPGNGLMNPQDMPRAQCNITRRHRTEKHSK